MYLLKLKIIFIWKNIHYNDHNSYDKWHSVNQHKLLTSYIIIITINNSLLNITIP